MIKTILILLIPFTLFAGYLYLKQKPVNSPTESTQTNLQPSPTTTLSSSNTLTLTKDGFTPQTIRVPIGTTVTWTNQSGITGDVSSSPHPEHTDDPFLNLGKFDDGTNLTLTFPNPGTFRYHDHLNSKWFGVIIVE